MSLAHFSQAVSKGLREELKTVQAQLRTTLTDLEARSKEFDFVKEQRAQLQANFNALSSDLAKSASQLEGERSIIAELKVTAANAERRAQDAAAVTQVRVQTYNS